MKKLIELMTYKGIKVNTSPKYIKNKKELVETIVTDVIDNIPFHLLEYLNSKGFEINIVTRNYIKNISCNAFELSKSDYIKARLFTFFESPKRSGIYVWTKTCIYVALYQNTQKILFHEIGHFLDFNSEYSDSYEANIQYSKLENKDSLYKSSNFEFSNDIYVSEKAFFKNDKGEETHYTVRFNEYFAEAFAYYFTDCETLKLKCPKTYNYIENFIENRLYANQCI